jgi:hypothetical protein
MPQSAIEAGLVDHVLTPEQMPATLLEHAGYVATTGRATFLDAVHHAAAKSYDTLLRRLEPRELVGLTATPERADGRPYA